MPACLNLGSRHELSGLASIRSRRLPYTLSVPGYFTALTTNAGL